MNSPMNIPMSIPMNIAEQVVGLVGARGEAQVLVHQGRHALTRFANSFIHQNVGNEGYSVTLKVAVDGRVASQTTTRVDGDGLAVLVKGALAAAALRPVDPDWPGLAPPEPVPDVEHYDARTEVATPPERAEQVAAFVAAGPGLRAAGYCDTEGGTLAFANSAGQRAEGRSSRATLDGIQQTADSAGSAHQTSSRLADLEAAARGAEAADRARRSSSPIQLDPGEYEVVLEPECVAAIVEFLCFYGFNAKQVLEGQSGIRLGEAQFDPAVDLWDDVAEPEAVGVAFDSDGTPKRRLDLVTGGVSRSLAQDRRTARRLDTVSTGHAFPGSDVYGPVATNVFMATGDATTADLVAGVRRGLLVTTFNYCRVLDPKTLVVTGLTRNGTFLVEDGQIGPGVANLRFTQSFLDALAPGQVLGVGAERRFADSEFFGTGNVSVPRLRLASFRFTGGARG